MAAEIVHDDDISGGQRGYQELLDISAKAEAVDRPIDDAGRVDPIAAQGGQEGQRTPAAIRHLGDQPRTAGAASVMAGSVCLWPRLVDGHPAPWVQPAPIIPLTGPAA